MRIHPVFAGLLLAWTLLAPAPAAAQDVFVPTASSLRPLQEVYVVVDAPCTIAGCGGEWVRGRIVDLTPSAMVVDDGQMRHQLGAADIRLVKRRGDSVLNGIGKGAVWGAVGGFLVPVITMAGECNPGCIIHPVMVGVAFATFGAGIGAAVGGIADARHRGERTVWERRRPVAKVVVAPLAGPRAGGVLVSVGF